MTYNKFVNDKVITEDAVQIVLECSVDTSMKGGVSGVLCALANVSGIHTTTATGQISAGGKLNVKAVYLNANGEVDNIDYICDFSKILPSENAVEDCVVCVSAKTIDVQTALSGDTVKIQVVVQLQPTVVVHNEFELLADCGDAYCTCTQSQFCTLEKSDESVCTVSEQYSAGAVVEKILLFDSNVNSCCVSGDKVSGDVCVNLVYQSEGVVTQKYFAIPFVQDIGLCEGANVYAMAEVSASRLVIGGSASDNVLDIQVDVQMKTMQFTVKEEQLPFDLFKPGIEYKISRLCMSYDCIGQSLCKEERISGSVEPQDETLGIGRICACNVVENSIATTEIKDNCIEVEGVACVCVLYKNGEDAAASVDIDLPYRISIDKDVCGDSFAVNTEICELSAKVKRDREIEVCATVSVKATAFERKSIDAITLAEEGEHTQPCEDAIAVYYASEGERLWDIAKKLSVSPQTIKEQNPEAEDVITGSEKIVVYRELAV